MMIEDFPKSLLFHDFARSWHTLNITAKDAASLATKSLWMFYVWLVFTSNLNNQTTWLKVKL